MKTHFYFIAVAMTMMMSTFTMQAQNSDDMDRTELCKKTYTELFGGEALTGGGTDPEFMSILQKQIFGEVFYIGDLDNKTRETITCVILSAMQTLPQLKAHAAAALNIGVTPLELREAIYLCAPVIGYPRTLNSISAINEVFTARGIELPLEPQGGVTNEENRYQKGLDIQMPIYDNEILEALAPLPDGMGGDVARMLTESFGDFNTRGSLSVKQRELYALCIMVTMRYDTQIRAHAMGSMRAGNSREEIVAAVIHCLPYIGFPNAIFALNIIKQISI